MSSRVIQSLVVCMMLVSVPLGLAGGLDYRNPPQGKFVDEWAVIRMGGQKCGYNHTVMTRKGDMVKSSTLEVLRISRAGQSISVTQLMNSEETVDGQPRSFAAEMDMAFRKVHMQGVVRDGKVVVQLQQFGNQITETLDYPSGALMTWGAKRAEHLKGYAAGTKFELSVYVPVLSTSHAAILKFKIEGEEEIEVDGHKRRGIRCVQEMHSPGSPMPLHLVTWVDPHKHEMLKMKMDVMGMPMEVVPCLREVALADFDPPEAFMKTLVSADKPIDRKTARRIKMKLVLEGEGPDLPPLPKTGMQTPSKPTDRSVVLDVARQDHTALAKAKKYDKPDKKALAEFCEPNIYINSGDPAVRKMADQAAGKAKTPYEIADRLRVYVSEKITDKNLNIGFASASEVCRNMSGDCSEHAVLLAALGRAKGVPSRVVCGLVYVPWFKGADNVFGFHMWTQFYINGQWVDFDAAQNESDCNPTHIALTVDSLHDSGLGDLAFAILPVMARLQIEIMECEPAGK
ncbi:MAG: transglutaminase domain-containing protein [Phycisphaerae bacterium]|nr:transglutaminase domain-containing protein [Phycisphaerae bacterium]